MSEALVQPVAAAAHDIGRAVYDGIAAACGLARRLFVHRKLGNPGALCAIGLPHRRAVVVVREHAHAGCHRDLCQSRDRGRHRLGTRDDALDEAVEVLAG
jgi:hypothetical protein